MTYSQDGKLLAAASYKEREFEVPMFLFDVMDNNLKNKL